MIYGNRFYAFNQPVKEAVEEVATESVALEFSLDNEGLLECVSNYYIEQADEMLASLEEDANQEYTDAFANGFSDYKDSFKTAKKEFKAKDYAAAKKDFEAAAKAADKIIKGIKKVNSDGFESWFVGNVVAGTIGLLIGCLLVAIYMIPVVGQILGTTITLVLDVEAVHSTINWLKAMLKDKENLAKAWNGYKNELETAAKFLKQIAEMSVKSCDKKMKEK